MRNSDFGIPIQYYGGLTMKRILLFILIIPLLIMTACGGGGGGGDNGPHAATQAIVKLSTAGTGTIGIVQMRLTLPTGVTVRATSSVTDSGVVTPSGNATDAELVYGIYSAPAVTVVVGKAVGFNSGEFAIVNCDIASGSTPVESDFSVSDLDARDADGKSITGLTPNRSVTFQ